MEHPGNTQAHLISFPSAPVLGSGGSCLEHRWVSVLTNPCAQLALVVFAVCACAVQEKAEKVFLQCRRG